MIYTNKRLNVKKQLVAVGKINKHSAIKSKTVKEMTNEEYRAMVDPLFSILNRKHV